MDQVAQQHATRNVNNVAEIRHLLAQMYAN